MAILVVCQSCKTRFQVNEKFAGKQGPCPKCKAVITIPKLDEQVVIHAPEEYAGGGSAAAKDASGRAVLKPLAREKPKLQPVMLVAAGAGVLVALVVAFFLKGSEPNVWILGGGAFLLAPPLVLAGYFAMRDAESEPYRGTALWLRAGIVAVVYAGLWGIAALFGTFVFTDASPEVWQLIPPTAIMVVAGTIASLATLDLEPINAFFHYAFYLVVTVLLRVVMGLAPLGGGAATPETSETVTRAPYRDSAAEAVGWDKQAGAAVGRRSLVDRTSSCKRAIQGRSACDGPPKFCASLSHPTRRRVFSA
ncbi:MAG: hypothetical protein WD894_10385 [Pirellulales bacterium]